MGYSIVVEDLKKSYGSNQALRGVSFQVAKGTCFGILGPNGAGKTTMLEIIEGVIPKDSGKILIQGLDHDTDRRKIQELLGVQLQENNFMENLTLRELIHFFMRMYKKKKVSVGDLLKKVDLEEKVDQMYASLSGGQKQRFSIALSLVNDPEILFLDEPTTGLDPQNRKFIWDLISGFKQQGKTIVLTTHNMEEADRLSDQLIIVDSGVIVATGTPEALKASLKGTRSVYLEMSAEIEQETLMTMSGVLQCRSHHSKQTWKVWTTELVSFMKDIFALAAKAGWEVNHLAADTVTLEDVFLNLTGKGLRE